jgi:hypothetical protein
MGGRPAWRFLQALSWLLLAGHASHGQVVNVDREVSSDTTSGKWAGNLNLSASADKQRRNVLDVSTRTECYRYLKSNYALIGLFQNDAVLLGRDAIQNEGMLHLRFRDKDSRRFSPEFFTQYQWNGGWGMEFRRLFGGNLRMKVFDKAGSDLYLSTGVFGEWERWNWSGVKQTIPTPPPSRVERRMLRWNQYVKYARKASEYLDISLISYLQFPLSGGFLRPRWYVDANAYLKATRKLSIVFHWDHVVDWNTPVPIDRIYYGFSTGVQVAW